jgi:MoaA/NifB/PqqE/SkfB family radical SAM enzyme
MAMRKNRFYYYYRLIKYRMLQDRSPIVAALKITQRCNLRCRHCAWEKKTEDELSFEDWKRIIDSLYSKGVTVIAVEGGEPTLYPEVSDIVSYIRSREMYCIFITNGTLDISDIKPDVFWISIDGMEKAHNMIRGAGTFMKVVRTIMAHGDKKIIALYSLARININDIEPFCEFFSPLLSGIMFNFVYPYGNIKEEALNRGERIVTAEKLMKLKKSYPKLMNSDSYLSSVGKNKKVHPWLLTTVTSDGRYIQGCIVRHIEQEDCSLCDMGCCIELSNAYALRPDSIYFWNLNFGLPRLI